MSTGPPPTAEDVLSAFGHAFDLLLRFSRRPVSGAVLLNGKLPTGMTIQLAPGQTFDYSVTYTDEWHNTVAESGPTTWTLEDAAGAATQGATLTPDTTSDQKGSGLVTAPAGTTGLRLHATMGTLDLTSDDISVQDGPAFTGTVTVSPVA